MFDRAEAIKLAEMERRKAMASENIARIRMEVSQKVRAAEAEWQVLHTYIHIYMRSTLTTIARARSAPPSGSLLLVGRSR